MTRRSRATPPSGRAIERYFRQFGRVIGFHQNIYNTNGFVVFETSKEAELVLSRQEHMVNGCMLQLTSSKRIPPIYVQGLQAFQGSLDAD